MFLLVALIPLVGYWSCRPASRKKPGRKDTARSYKEQHRPQYHFSPETSWMNDPNGMVYYEGEYHLFYQYYPDSTVWGPMHWGHAVSTDLVHWEHLPIALYPDSLGYIFSGSAVIDWQNTSGFGTTDTPPMVAIYTYHDMEAEKAGATDYQTQGIAYSLDKGRTWTKYEGNPVMANNTGIKDFRDPKVIWDAARNQWVMALALNTHDQFWASPDLKNWTLLSEWGHGIGAHSDGPWECPDLFPMKAKETGEEKWVLIQSLNPGGYNGGSGTQYFIGDFDGKTFTLDPDFAQDVQDNNGLWIDWGRDNYAGVTWSGAPTPDDEKLFIGWMSNWEYAQVVPTERWRSAMTIPRKLTLHQTEAGYRLFSTPVQGLDKLVTKEEAFEATVSAASHYDASAHAPAAQSAWEVTIDAWQGVETLGLALSNDRGERYTWYYKVSDHQFYSDRTAAGNIPEAPTFAERLATAPRHARSESLTLQFFLDAASIEVFADGGSTVMTEIFFPSEDFTRITFFTLEGSARISGTARTLGSIW